jgi:hypothetical protein
MSSSLLEAAFAHHAWATTRLIDACLDLSVEELETSVLGTRGPMLETLRHVVLSDAEELFFLTGNVAFDIDEEHVSLAEARVIMERNGSGWAEYISRSLDPDTMVLEVDKTDGKNRGVSRLLDHSPISPRGGEGNTVRTTTPQVRA